MDSQHKNTASTGGPPEALDRSPGNGKDALPPQFVERLSRVLPPRLFEQAMRSFALPRAVGFRVNLLRSTAERLQEELEAEGLPYDQVGWYPDAFTIPHACRERLLEMSAYREGRLYVQNLSSMLPPLVLQPEPGERVLDLTAAPGSKTLQMAGMMQGEGELAAVELVRPRFFRLKANLEAQGAGFVRAFLKNGETVWRNRPEYFDRVLLDAPCSSEGRFSLLEPESYVYWSPRKVKEMAGKQQRLLYSAIQATRPGGTIVYSTCSLSPEENEAVLNRVLARFKDAVEIVEPGAAVPDWVPGLDQWDGTGFDVLTSATRRIVPDDRMEGFFVAKLHKLASTM